MAANLRWPGALLFTEGVLSVYQKTGVRMDQQGKKDTINPYTYFRTNLFLATQYEYTADMVLVGTTTSPSLVYTTNYIIRDPDPASARIKQAMEKDEIVGMAGNIGRRQTFNMMAELFRQTKRLQYLHLEIIYSRINMNYRNIFAELQQAESLRSLVLIAPGHPAASTTDFIQGVTAVLANNPNLRELVVRIPFAHLNTYYPAFEKLLHAVADSHLRLFKFKNRGKLLAPVYLDIEEPSQAINHREHEWEETMQGNKTLAEFKVTYTAPADHKVSTTLPSSRIARNAETTLDFAWAPAMINHNDDATRATNLKNVDALKRYITTYAWRIETIVIRDAPGEVAKDIMKHVSSIVADRAPVAISAYIILAPVAPVAPPNWRTVKAPRVGAGFCWYIEPEAGTATPPAPAPPMTSVPSGGTHAELIDAPIDAVYAIPPDQHLHHLAELKAELDAAVAAHTATPEFLAEITTKFKDHTAMFLQSIDSSSS